MVWDSIKKMISEGEKIKIDLSVEFPMIFHIYIWILIIEKWPTVIKIIEGWGG
jgi:hypothetical protein